MSRPLRVYIGWDQRDALAYEVCERSLRKNASGPVEVIALKDWERTQAARSKSSP
jgi:hypothetical protein